MVGVFHTKGTMDKRKINILGHELTIVYNMATQIAYEEITNATFSVEALEKSRNSMALYWACIVANNPDTKLTFDELLTDATAADVKILRDSVMESFTDWCKTVVGDEQSKDEGNEKNA